MYACKQCGTGNPLDSSFCKKCGSPLPAEDMAEARRKLSEMLDEGNNLFTEGRTEEAMLIAESAITANPSSHLAYSLKGLCHERLGQIAEALECYEMAVNLDAESSLDKVKVAALRNRLAQRAAEPTEPNRRSAAMIGVAAAVLVLVAGALTAIGMGGHGDKGKLAMSTPPTTPISNGQAQANAPANAQPNPPPGTNPTAPSNPVQGNQSTAQPGGTAERVDGDEPAMNLPKYTGSQLPGVEGNIGTPAHVDNGPVVLKPDGPVTPTDGPAGGTRNPDPNPGPLTTSSPPTGTTVTATKQEDQPGYIHIEMAPSTNSTPGGGEVISGAASDGNGMTAVMKVAQQEFQLGHYDSAASKYNQVANMGGNSPRVQQRLGDCYRNLGNSNRARSAYNRAITMYQAQIKQGVNVPANQRGLETCESALKVLGG